MFFDEGSDARGAALVTQRRAERVQSVQSAHSKDVEIDDRCACEAIIRVV